MQLNEFADCLFEFRNSRPAGPAGVNVLPDFTRAMCRKLAIDPKQQILIRDVNGFWRHHNSPFIRPLEARKRTFERNSDGSERYSQYLSDFPIAKSLRAQIEAAAVLLRKRTQYQRKPLLSLTDRHFFLRIQGRMRQAVDVAPAADGPSLRNPLLEREVMSHPKEPTRKVGARLIFLQVKVER